MLSTKRKYGHSGLERRVRPRKDEESDVEFESDEVVSAKDDGEDGAASESSDSLPDEDEGVVDGDSKAPSDQDENDEDEARINLSEVSFGDLKRAQKALSSSRRGPEQTPSSKPRTTTAKELRKAKPPKSGVVTKRSSKHAPTEMPTKRPVGRHRDFLDSHLDGGRKPEAARDPRFDPLCGHVDETSHRRDYAFLDKYRDAEIAKLRADAAGAKRRGDEGRAESLKRQLLSMETKRLAKKRRDEERNVLEEHLKREKALVKEGKKPFYLKKAELKKKVLEERFKGMSEGQVDRSIMRRRKKVAGKEKKEMARVEMVSAKRRGARNAN